MQHTGFPGDRRAVTSVYFAASAVALLAMTGLVIDIGNIFSARRHLQGTTDMAAIAAATNLPNATQAANANATINAYTAADISNIELGVYTPDPSLPPSSRFQPSSLTSANAARITMTHPQGLFFGGVFAMTGNGGTPQNTQSISTQGIAVNENVADFSVGTTVAAYNGGVVNSVLGAAVGGNVSLSAIDYQSLVSTNVDLFGVAHALAIQQGQVGGTYAQAFAGTVPLETFLAAVVEAAPGAAGAVQDLANQASGNTTVDLSRLVGFGPFANVSLSDPEPNVTATASALSLVQAALQLGGAAHLISFSIGANVPGVLGATGLMTLGEPPVNSTVIAVGQTGSTVHTSQIRLYLNVSLLGAGIVPVVQMPVYMEVGYATASLASLSCQPLDGTSTSATLDVTPGLVNGWIGSVTPAQMINYTQEPTPSPATLVNLGLVTVTGAANATIGNLSPTAVKFSYTDIQNKTVKTTDTTDYLGSLLTNLVTHTTLTVNGAGLPGLPQAVTAILQGGVTPVDQLLGNVLQTMGVSVGEASSWIDGARCGPAILAG